jgi:murein L,D-transpeptidase YafK
MLSVLSSFSLGAEKADFVLVEKSTKTLFLYKEGKLLDKFPVVFGANPVGHKEMEGDEKTPEGGYVLDYKKEDSAFYKAIHISYPNEKDIEHAKIKGVSPGGAIMVHGQKNRFGLAYFISQYFNWTNGCVALSNENMEHVWQAVEAGTRIEIKP